MFSGWRTVLSLCAAVAVTGAAPVERRAAASSATGSAFLTVGAPFEDSYQSVQGAFSLEVRDRSSAAAANEGDTGTMTARVQVGAVTYLVQVSRPGWSLEREPHLGGPRQLQGGVMLDAPVHGRSGRGTSRFPQTEPAVWMWGWGTVLRNGQLLADNVSVEVFVTMAGLHADDDTHRLMRETRPGDAEAHVLVRGLRTSGEPGFLQVTFEDLRLERDGLTVVAQRPLPNVPERSPTEQREALRRSAQREETFPSTPYALPGAAAAANLSGMSGVSGPSVSTDGVGGAGSSGTAAGTGTSSGGTGSEAAVNTSGIEGAAASGGLTVGEGTPTGDDGLPGRPETPRPLNLEPGLLPTPRSVEPSNATPADPLLRTERPLNAEPAGPFPTTPRPLNAEPAEPLTATPPPANAAPAPANAAPAESLPVTTDLDTAVGQTPLPGSPAVAPPPVGTATGPSSGSMVAPPAASGPTLPSVAPPAMGP